MAAPTLQAQGATDAVTTSVPSVVIPAHQANDIIVVDVVIWAPGTIGDVNAIPTPSGFGIVGSELYPPSVEIDGRRTLFWKRATGSSETVTLTRGASWDTGTDTCYGARAYVIRGCVATGNPWDATVVTAARTTANTDFLAVTVSGSERMVVQFGGSTDNQAFAMTSTGWTTGSEDPDVAGTDCNFQTARQDNVSVSTTADTATVSAPAQGFYGFIGVSFKPPTVPRPAAPIRVAGQAVARASSWFRRHEGLVLPERRIWVPGRAH